MRPQDQHDPGGRVRLALPEGMTGTADFSSCGRYRYLMSRDWTPDGVTPRAVLFLGMNPSTACASKNDPTCAREVTFSRDWGYTRYLKGNVLGWRATNPRDLPQDPVQAQGPENLDRIIAAAKAAETDLIVAAYGKLSTRYHGVIDETISRLRATNIPVMCLGRNKDGSAKHPLYLRKTTPLQPF